MPLLSLSLASGASNSKGVKWGILYVLFIEATVGGLLPEDDITYIEYENFIEEFSEDGKVLTIYIEEKFNFGNVQEFRVAYSQDMEKVESIVINLQKTEYMDSSALGMLLNMQKSVSATVSHFKIIHSRPQVLKILQIARFDKKFDIE